jgi:hypothetical protein
MTPMRLDQETDWEYGKMRPAIMILQHIALTVGAMALGALSSGIGLLYLSSWTVFRARQGQDPSLNWGAAIGMIAFAVCGGTTGAIAGLVAALRVIARRESEAHAWHSLEARTEW